MNILELFTGKKENSLGKFEVTSDNLTNVFKSIVDKADMLNPTGVKTSAHRAVSVKYDGSKFIILIHAYNPPLQITWTGFNDINKLAQVVANLSKTSKKVGFMNLRKLEHGTEVFQLALA